MDEKTRLLRKHKNMATGLFFLMAATYALCVWASSRYTSGWIGYLEAFSEAAMVGALADWFAVTALFHHPLGIPIPHTNLIEKRKQAIGDNLGNFVVQNFLTAANLRPYIQQLSVSKFAINWLTNKKNQLLLADEISGILKNIILKLDDAEVTVFISRKAVELSSEIPTHKLIANGLEYFLDEKEDDKIMTLLATKIKQYIGTHQDMIQEKVQQESYFFIPKFVDNKLAEKISRGLVTYFEEIEKDEAHRVRIEVKEQLRKFISDMRTLPKWEKQLKELTGKLLTPEQIAHYADDIWTSVKQNLITSLSEDSSAIKNYFRKSIADFSESLKNDKDMQQRIDKWVRATAYKYILKNTQAVGSLISKTVGNWQGRELSRKLELEVGKDLQFIRINGTIVGGLVGLLIYTITQLARP